MTTVTENFPAAIRRRYSASVSAAPLYPLPYLIALCAILMFAILAFGAGEIWANSILEIGAAFLFTALVVHKICVSALPVRWNPLYAPMLGFAVVAIAQLAFNLTSYRYATLLVCLQYFSYAALLFVATQVAADGRFLRILVLTLIIFGSAVALFAICQYLSDAPKMYWLRSPGTNANFFGPYVNRDHYAGLMEMLVAPAVVLSVGRLAYGPQRILTALAAILMAGSLVLTLSRGGVISLVAELLLLLWITSRVQTGDFVRNRLFLGIGLMLAFLAFAGSSTMWSHLVDVQETFRADVLRDSLRMFVHKPILGWGLGTFDTVYPTFRSFYTTAFVNTAHDDYLQLLVETGVLGFGCGVWFVVVLFRSSFGSFRHWNQSWRGALQLSALVACTGLLVHSALDFNLQVPGNAALFYVFCALATSLSQNVGRAAAFGTVVEQDATPAA